MFRGAVALCLLVLLAVTVDGTKKKYAEDLGATSIHEGTHNHGDTNMIHETIKSQNGNVPWLVQEHDICYPDKLQRRFRFIITEFSVKSIDKRGLVYHKSGGVGKRKVCFKIKSHKGTGYEFDIDIWGHY